MPKGEVNEIPENVCAGGCRSQVEGCGVKAMGQQKGNESLSGLLSRHTPIGTLF